MGTIESTRDRNWTWILQSPVADVIEAGVDFDPAVRTVRAIQGDAATGGALEVRFQARIFCILILGHINLTSMF